MQKVISEKLADVIMRPNTVERLKVWLAAMDPTMPVFCIEVGDVEGNYKWKAKKGWKQWLKEQVLHDARRNKNSDL